MDGCEGLTLQKVKWNKAKWMDGWMERSEKVQKEEVLSLSPKKITARTVPSERSWDEEGKDGCDGRRGEAKLTLRKHIWNRAMNAMCTIYKS